MNDLYFLGDAMTKSGEVSVFCDCCVSICDLVLVSTNKLQRQLRGGFEV